MKYDDRLGCRLISMAMILLMLLPLFTACAPLGVTIVNSSLEIPEGWEIVSQEDGVTHIRMKEGSDAYYWIVAEKQNDFYMELDFPGNRGRASMKPDKDGNVHFAVYLGYDQVQRKFMGSPIEPSAQDAYRLIFNDTGMYQSWKELYEFDVEAVTTQSNVVYDSGTVGLTEAVIYSIPISKFSNVYDEMSFFIQYERDKVGDYLPEVYPTSTDVHMKIELYFCQMHDMIHFDGQYEKAVRASFPYVLYEHYEIVSLVLTALAIVLTVLFAKKKTIRLLALIPCAVGSVFSWLTSQHYTSLPTSVHEMFGGLTYSGEEFMSFIGIFRYILLAVLLLIAGWIVDMIRCRIQKKTAENTVKITEDSNE